MTTNIQKCSFPIEVHDHKYHLENYKDGINNAGMKQKI